MVLDIVRRREHALHREHACARVVALIETSLNYTCSVTHTVQDCGYVFMTRAVFILLWKSCSGICELQLGRRSWSQIPETHYSSCP